MNPNQGPRPGSSQLELFGTTGGEDQGVFGGGILDGGHLPMKCAKFGEPAVVAFIGGEYPNAQPPGAHRNQCVVGQPPLSNLFVVVLGRQASKHSARLSPIAEIG